MDQQFIHLLSVCCANSYRRVGQSLYFVRSVGNNRRERKKKMRPKEVAYLIFNVPFCLALFVVLVIISQGLNYNYSNWNPNAETTFIVIFLTIFLLDLILMGWLKILNKRVVFLTLLELAVVYSILSIFF